MRQRVWFSALVLAGGLLSGTATADYLVTREAQPPATGKEDPPAKETYTIWVGDSRLREDRRNRSMIVDRSTGKLYVVKHSDKTYYALDLPVDFESLVPSTMLTQWRSVLEARKPTLTIEPSSEKATVRGFDVSKHVAVLTSPDGTATRLTFWNAKNPGFDPAEYKTLMREVNALQPGSSEWIGELYDAFEGYPVRMLRAATTPAGELVWSEELVSVEEKTAPQGIWAPAADYTEVEFSLLSVAPE
jgi:hypothetical protein